MKAVPEEGEGRIELAWEDNSDRAHLRFRGQMRFRFLYRLPTQFRRQIQGLPRQSPRRLSRCRLPALRFLSRVQQVQSVERWVCQPAPVQAWAVGRRELEGEQRAERRPVPGCAAARIAIADPLRDYRFRNFRLRRQRVPARRRLRLAQP